MTEVLQAGILNIDKPMGWTSHDVVAKIRSLLNMKAGHLGTLDPMATGVLPICFGKGTRASAYLMEAEKEYEAVMRLGEETDTQDASGTCLRTTAIPAYLLDRLSDTLKAFTGTLMQSPPMYSAIKVRGVPLYKMARQGKVIPRAPRPVTLRSLRLMGWDGRDAQLHVVCSKGTYIRTLCADIGEHLGLGGHLLSLRRTRVGMFPITESLTLETFSQRVAEGTWMRAACRLNEALGMYPAVVILGSRLHRLKQGVPMAYSDCSIPVAFERGTRLRLLEASTQELIGVGEACIDTEEAEKHPTKPCLTMKTYLGV